MLFSHRLMGAKTLSVSYFVLRITLQVNVGSFSKIVFYSEELTKDCSCSNFQIKKLYLKTSLDIQTEMNYFKIFYLHTNVDALNTSMLLAHF